MNEDHLLCVKENIPNKLVNIYCFPEENKVITTEFSISNKKWLLLSKTQF